MTENPTKTHAITAAEYVQRVLAEYNGQTVEIIDLTDDKQRAYVTSVENKGIFDKRFVRHVGWCDAPSGYVDREALTNIRADVVAV